jgi:uncharacterized protein YcbK (DUF882 family)
MQAIVLVAALAASWGSPARAARPLGHRARLLLPRSAVSTPLPAIELMHLTTHATLTLRPASKSGGFGRKSLRAVNQLLRCHHTGQRHAISQRLVDIIYQTARHFRSAKVLVIAGYRAPQVAKQKGNPRSHHKLGLACDFRLVGVSIEALRDHLRRTYRHIGVGYYPNSGFVHVDVGRGKDAFWVDYSGPGQPARIARSATAETDDRTE